MLFQRTTNEVPLIVHRDQNSTFQAVYDVNSTTKSQCCFLTRSMGSLRSQDQMKNQQRLALFLVLAILKPRVRPMFEYIIEMGTIQSIAIQKISKNYQHTEQPSPPFSSHSPPIFTSRFCFSTPGGLLPYCSAPSCCNICFPHWVQYGRQCSINSIRAPSHSSTRRHFEHSKQGRREVLVRCYCWSDWEIAHCSV